MDFYHRAGLILDALDNKKGSVKGLCMAEAKKGRKAGEGARFLKVVVEVLKYRPHIQHLLTATKLLAQEPTLFVPPSSTAAVASALKSGSAASANKALKTPRKHVKAAPSPLSLASVMVHDLLFAKRGLTLPKEHKVRKKLEKYQPALEKENEREKRRRKVATNEGLQIALPEKVASSLEGIGKGKKRAHDADRFAEEGAGSDGAPGEIRWMRVNTLRWTVEAAVEWLEKCGWEMFEDVEEMLAAAQSKPKVFALDAHIEPLLALPAAVSLPTISAYQDGRLLAQDKASCMPAWVLLMPALLDAEERAEAGLLYADEDEDEEKKAAGGDAKGKGKAKSKGIRVLDATAAPGNKTTMAAALVATEGINGRVVACERDQGRFKVLKDMLKRADAKNVQPMNVDFLSLKPDDAKLKNVTHLLVDPSCSGSGIPSRLDHLLPSAPEDEQLARIRALSNFQLAIVSHALRFSGAQRVVYSTCSIWEQEDEGVVMRVLAKKEFRDAGWRLAPRDEVMPTWERRGRVEACGGDETIADSLVRCLPEDGTNGFFVACFVKDETAAPIAAPAVPAAAAAADEGEEDAALEPLEDEDVTEGASAPAVSAQPVKKGGKAAKKAKSTASQAARKAKDEVLGLASAPAAAKESGNAEVKAPAKKGGEGGKKLSKKQMYLLKKEELKRKKEAAQE
ncbi:rRNA (cytosine-C5-)-methyltransferase RCM1 [Rhodotorula paludigena]|uniref:rRNA (cytosine-C5-)-methyltransferase RCM1 n=1 Tax=Rhodotorula paludigena TaxID=86838 RepID=UPI00317CED60